jgi:hypothetical protein
MTSPTVFKPLFFSLNFAVIGLFYLTSTSADELADRILPLREQAVIKDDILRERLDTLIEPLMRRNSIEAWVLIAREYNEDPIVKTMLPSSWLNARRRTVLMFVDHGEARGVERVAVARYAVADMFPGVWNPEEEPDQWQRIAQILNEFDPQSIALNFSDNYALADGLTFSEQREFMNALPSRLQERIVSSENLAVGWLETRTDSEIEVYRDVMSVAHDIIREGFSADVIQPGTTSIEDLQWWFQQRVNNLGLQTWFHTDIEVERSDQSKFYIAENGLDENILYRGDHVHIDFGISYLNLQTDTQQNAYILRENETDVPENLKTALKAGNDLQDILTRNFEVGRTGNDILRITREQSLERGIGPIIYTHPIGLHGHAAGATIGMWDKQGGVPGTGDYPMQANTAYSIELTAEVDIPDWSSEPMKMKLEEDGFFDGENFEYIQPRQTRYHIIDGN